jgi:crotonobetainyl-CoA:carnitine CoA-transferase CaiB-like acyl-CoA transferase
MTNTPRALDGVKVLDLSRVLAGPWCGQLLGDLGADVVKVERPGAGDDTRGWGPPWLKDADGAPTRDAAYYFCANRNKRSVAIDIATPEGRDLARRLALEADVVLENFKVGGLAPHGLDYASLAALKPSLVYCSITGFGQTGPYAQRAGYDFLIQGLGGLMSVTGRADGEAGAGPQKVGVALTDVLAGLYAAVGVLAALAHRDRTGQGQHIDLALLDVQLACLANQTANYLIGGEPPRRLGNAHPNIVPYQDFPTADGDMILAIGNDGQFARFCGIAGHPEWPIDARFATNGARVQHRAELVPLLRQATILRTTRECKGQMQAADFVMTPNIQIAANDTGGLGGSLAGGLLSRVGLGGLSGGLKFKEAQTSLLVSDVRSSIQVASAEGKASKTDFSVGGWGWTCNAVGAMNGYTNTPEGKVIAASLLDNYNRIVLAIRDNPSLIKTSSAAGDANAAGSTRAGVPIKEGQVFMARIGNVKIYEKPSRDSKVVGTLSRSDELIASGQQQNGFVQVDSSNFSGWVQRALVGPANGH